LLLHVLLLLLRCPGRQLPGLLLLQLLKLRLHFLLRLRLL
jgi:hypothetical protein